MQQTAAALCTARTHELAKSPQPTARLGSASGPKGAVAQTLTFGPERNAAENDGLAHHTALASGCSQTLDPPSFSALFLASA